MGSHLIAFRFITSKEEEDLASEPGIRLDHSRAFVQHSFIQVRKWTEKLLT